MKLINDNFILLNGVYMAIKTQIPLKLGRSEKFSLIIRQKITEIENIHITITRYQFHQVYELCKIGVAISLADFGRIAMINLINENKEFLPDLLSSPDFIKTNNKIQQKKKNLNPIPNKIENILQNGDYMATDSQIQDKEIYAKKITADLRKKITETEIIGVTVTRFQKRQVYELCKIGVASSLADFGRIAIIALIRENSHLLPNNLVSANYLNQSHKEKVREDKQKKEEEIRERKRLKVNQKHRDKRKKEKIEREKEGLRLLQEKIDKDKQLKS